MRGAFILRAPVPGRGHRHGGTRPSSARASDDTAASSAARATVVVDAEVPCNDTARTWAELVGLMDPILENAIDRTHHMNEQERNQLYLGLVRFLGIFMAEVLRLLAMALQPEGDATSLVQSAKAGYEAWR